MLCVSGWIASIFAIMDKLMFVIPITGWQVLFRRNNPWATTLKYNILTHLDCCCCCCCKHRCRRHCFFAAATVVGGETRRRHDNRARWSSNGAVDAASFPQPPRLAGSRDDRATWCSGDHSCRTRSPVETRAQSSTMRYSDVVSTVGLRSHRRNHHNHHLGLQMFIALLCLTSGKSRFPSHSAVKLISFCQFTAII